MSGKKVVSLWLSNTQTAFTAAGRVKKVNLDINGKLTGENRQTKTSTGN